MHCEIRPQFKVNATQSKNWQLGCTTKQFRHTKKLHGGLYVNKSNCKRLLPDPCAKKGIEREIWQHMRLFGCPFGAGMSDLRISYDLESSGVHTQSVRVHIHEEHLHFMLTGKRIHY